MRKEYLYRKSLEEQEQQKFERKQKLKEALRGTFSSDSNTLKNGRLTNFSLFVFAPFSTEGKRIDNQKELQAEADTYLYDEAQAGKAFRPFRGLFAWF